MDEERLREIEVRHKIGVIRGCGDSDDIEALLVALKEARQAGRNDVGDTIPVGYIEVTPHSLKPGYLTCTAGKGYVAVCACGREYHDMEIVVYTPKGTVEGCVCDKGSSVCQTV